MTDLITKIEQGCKTDAQILGVTSTVAQWRELLDLLKQRGPKPLEWERRKARSEMAQYRCKHCGKTVQRNSRKAWIKSICETTGRMVRLVRVRKYRPRNNG